ncbi:MAG: GNAT family N-acetyltransferase [Thomasclavelia sp.]|uniref:GNAT family N-acetyltransferase n=1 Tax=Thomasclavelia sp. TaxID=3025757 RepID=UPI0039A2D0BB
MIIELASLKDIDEIEKFYNKVVDDLVENNNYPGWKKGIYPTRLEAVSGIENQELYVVRFDNKIIGSVVINHKQEKNYYLAPWKIEAKDKEIYVIHTLAIHPQYKGLKIAQKLLEYVEGLAKQNKIKAIRLDVRQGNIPAIKLYEKCGFVYISEINLDFRGEDLGLFDLYEKII